MNILVNFVPVRSGGGQQVAYNFMLQVSKEYYDDLSFFFLVGTGTYLHDMAQSLGLKYLSINYSYFNRLLISFYTIHKIINLYQIDIILSFAPTFHTRAVPQVVRSVYSNLYFPEIDFWHNFNFLHKTWKKFIDSWRKSGTLRADALIFENKEMQSRAIRLFGYPAEKTLYISPSVSNFNTADLYTEYEFIKDLVNPKILLLTSWHPNKNLTILPSVALNLKLMGFNVKFVITLSENHKQVKKYLLNNIKTLGLSDFFIFIGDVKPQYVHQIVSYCDAILLLSKLECFSSNIAEAWAFNKLLIIADEPWSRAVCEDGALYVNRDDANDIANKIYTIFCEDLNQTKIIMAGSEAVLNLTD